MSSRRRDPDGEQFTDDAETGAEDVFQRHEFDDIGSVDAAELEWEAESESDDEQNRECTADSDEVHESQLHITSTNVPSEAMARLRDRRSELEQVAASDLPAESIATELLRILTQQDETT